MGVLHMHIVAVILRVIHKECVTIIRRAYNMLDMYGPMIFLH